MSNTVSPNRPSRWGGQVASLYAADGTRKYVNAPERARLLSVVSGLSPERALFVRTLAWTGARISEVLSLKPASFQVECGLVAIVTLKRRDFFVREVPIPPDLMDDLEAHFGITVAQADPEHRMRRLWPWSRITGWRLIKAVMEKATVSGPHACPKGLRHAFGLGTLQAKVPIHLTQIWLGHARLSTTAIYAAACGPEELAFAAQFWRMPSAGMPQAYQALREELRKQSCLQDNQCRAAPVIAL